MRRVTKAKQKRDAAKGMQSGAEAEDGKPGTTVSTAGEPGGGSRPAPRQQPKKQSRQARKKGGAPRAPGNPTSEGEKA